MSATVSFTGNTSVLTSDFYPYLELEKGCSYSCALLEFTSYYSVPNVTKQNNRLYFKTVERLVKTSNGLKLAKLPELRSYYYYIEIPVGAYELKDIAEYLKVELANIGVTFSLAVNPTTLKSLINCSEELHFNAGTNSIHSLLGFNGNVKLPINRYIASDYPVAITTLNTIVVDCDIVSGSYTNGKSGHSLYEFAPTVAPGFKIIEVPKHIVYLPVNKRSISSIQVRITDQDGKLIDFQNEKISCRLHIKKD